MTHRMAPRSELRECTDHSFFVTMSFPDENFPGMASVPAAGQSDDLIFTHPEPVLRRLACTRRTRCRGVAALRQAHVPGLRCPPKIRTTSRCQQDAELTHLRSGVRRTRSSGKPSGSGACNWQDHVTAGPAEPGPTTAVPHVIQDFDIDRTSRHGTNVLPRFVSRQTMDLSFSAWSLHKTAMFQINPRLSGFTCLRTGVGLPVGDYHEGSPDSAKEGFPASLYATYRGNPRWPPAGPDKGMARFRDFLPYLDFPALAKERRRWYRCRGWLTALASCRSGSRTRVRTRPAPTRTG